MGPALRQPAFRKRRVRVVSRTHRKYSSSLTYPHQTNRAITGTVPPRTVSHPGGWERECWLNIAEVAATGSQRKFRASREQRRKTGGHSRTLGGAGGSGDLAVVAPQWLSPPVRRCPVQMQVPILNRQILQKSPVDSPAREIRPDDLPRLRTDPPIMTEGEKQGNAHRTDRDLGRRIP